MPVEWCASTVPIAMRARLRMHYTTHNTSTCTETQAQREQFFIKLTNRCFFDSGFFPSKIGEKKSNDKQKLFPDNDWFRGDMIARQMVAGFFHSLVDDDVIVIVVVDFLSFRPENVTGIDYFVYRMTLHFKWSALFSNLQNKIYFQAVVIVRDKFHMCNCSENNMKDDEKNAALDKWIKSFHAH